MSKADKMFEELGYEKSETSFYVEVSNDEGNCINFWKTEKTYDCDVIYINVDLHLAIHEKMKELGWIK